MQGSTDGCFGTQCQRAPLIVAAIIFSCVVGSSPLRAQGAAADVRAIASLDSLWARNYAANDTVAASRLMAPDFFMTSGTGATKNRDAELADIRPTAGLTMKYFRSESPAIHVYGSAAVVSGFASWAFDRNGQLATFRRKYVAVYTRGGPLGWRLQELHMAAG